MLVIENLGVGIQLLPLRKYFDLQSYSKQYIYRPNCIQDILYVLKRKKNLFFVLLKTEEFVLRVLQEIRNYSSCS